MRKDRRCAKRARANYERSSAQRDWTPVPVPLEQMLAAHYRTRFFAALHIELLIDAADLGFDGVDGDDQCLGNLRVGVSGPQQAQHPLLLWAEWRDGLSWNRIA